MYNCFNSNVILYVIKTFYRKDFIINIEHITRCIIAYVIKCYKTKKKGDKRISFSGFSMYTQF